VETVKIGTIEEIREQARELLSSGAVDHFIGYEASEDLLHVAPSFVRNEQEVDTLAWNLFCINNLATYLKRYRTEKIGLIVKGCDSRSLIELLKLNQIKRENLHIVGVPCAGILDPQKVAAVCDPATITEVREEDDIITIERGTRGPPIEQPKDNLVFDKCLTCAYPTPLVYDTLIGNPIRPRRGASSTPHYDDVEHLEMMPATERLAFWNEQLNKCIRCYACKNVCPMCFCTECLWEKRDPQWVTKYKNPRDIFTFHMIRAYHMVGRCTGCLECERVCPMDIPLGTIFRKIQKDGLELFDYQPGVSMETMPPLSTYDEGDQAHEDLLR
jgi:ferredoxin